MASRCVQVEFPALVPEVIARVLVDDGVAPDAAEQVAAAAHGDVDRARLLASDPRFALRVQAWREVPSRLDGTGATVGALVAELRAAIDDASTALTEVHAREVEEVNERIERYGQRRSGAKVLEESHKRQLRRLRTDEVRMGLGELAHAFRDRLVDAASRGDDRAVDEAAAAIAVVDEALDALVRNPNEELLLQATFLRLTP
jgi:DNA polymerase-3 subunit delta'